jgi:DNA-directed RNA polymerase specialized sigma24 family protein
VDLPYRPQLLFHETGKSAFAPAGKLSLDELTPASGITDWRALPDQAAQLGEMRSLLERAITALPDLYKNVLLLRDLEETVRQGNGGDPRCV